MKTNALKAFAFLLACTFFLVSCENKRPGKPLVLVFSKTAGFPHQSIPKGKEAIMKLASENNFDVDTTSNADWFNEETLEKYSAVIFLSTTGDLLNNHQEADFERYIQAGGGFVGIHGAADAENDWGWYGRLVGGYFKDHPKVQEAKLEVRDKNHPSTKGLPDTWMHTDEWYNFNKLSKDVTVLINLDETSYQGGSHGAEHPIAWYQEFDGGRSFYTGLGHTDEVFQDSLFLAHLLGGIEYAIGDNLVLDYSKAKSLRTPTDESFSKTTLTQGGFYEPTEMAILPNLDILVSQRRGELMLYSNATNELSQVGFLDVYFKTDVPRVNAEEGFLGLAADPNFEKNNFIYAYYSPADTSVNRLSRFEFKENKLNMESETVVLEFYSQRDICCHTGGSIAFGADGLLYLSTGDNSTPFNEFGQPYVNRGFAPLDVRPGHEQYDAARSSGNTNDLRGKILRIKVNEDGSYEIPQGNLFPEGKEKTKPEIYVMGNRNPYRISVDQKTNYLYWGEVGPDANQDSMQTRGPKGYDEINQAREAGFFGWPFFVADNYPYVAYDYATGKSGAPFDAAKPINNSPNNTGLKELPPAQPAFIWYPYDVSKEFSDMGTGGRNAMAGPVYYTNLYNKETRYPEYYNGKLFIYDWVRSWVKVVTMAPNGDFDKMEPFASHIPLAAPIDMEVGPDGRIYVLEYGKGWFTKNPDAGITRIDYTAEDVSSKSVTKSTQEKPTGDENYEDLDKAGHDLGHKEADDIPKGQSLILASDCQSCHSVDRTSVGPSYNEIAKRYKEETGAVDLLAKKIINGSSGVWGEVVMPPHKNMPEAEAKEIVKWILSL